MIWHFAPTKINIILDEKTCFVYFFRKLPDRNVKNVLFKGKKHIFLLKSVHRIKKICMFVLANVNFAHKDIDYY